MRGIEGANQPGQERLIEGATGRSDADFHRLAGVADVRLADQPDARRVDAVALQRRHGLALQRGVARGDLGKIDRLLVHHLGDDVVGAPIDCQQAERREIAGVRRHDARLHGEQVHDRGGLRGTRAAERQQRKGARIDAALDRHLPDRVGLVPIGDFDDAAGELLDAHVARQFGRQRRDAAARPFDIEGNTAAD